MTPDYAYTPAIWAPLIGAAFLACLSLYSWRHRRIPGALPLAAGSSIATIWLLGLAMEASAAAPATAISWVRFQALFQLAGVTATTCFVLEYTYPGRWLTRRNLILLSLPPLLGVLAVVANGGQFMWRSLEVGPDGRPAPQYTAAGAVLVAYGLGLILVNTAAFLSRFIRSPEYRWPVALMLSGELAARVLYVMDRAKPAWLPGFDLVVAAIVLVWTLYGIALFGFRILDPLGAARQTLLRQMREGMVVFDEEWRVVSANPAAEKILGAAGSRFRGKRWEDVLPLPRGLTGQTAPPDPAGDASPALAEMWLGHGGAARCYALNLSLLKDQRGLEVGRLLLLLDTTGQRQAQALIQQQQRTLAVTQERERLARELHDGLGQVLAFVNAQGQATRRLLARGEVQAADELLCRLIEVAQEADKDIRESILGLRAGLTEAGLVPTLAAYLVQYEQRYGIRTELRADPGLASDPFEPLVEVQLLRITQEALANARKHSGARSVSVGLVAQDHCACLTVEDDGRGFEVQEALAEARGRVGLRVMQERAEEAGGSLEVQSAQGRGTRVVVTLPLVQAGSV